MTFKEKGEYLWFYYKMPLFMTLFLAAILVALVNVWFINPPKQEYLFMAWVASYEDPDSLQLLSTRMTDGLVENPDRQEVPISSFYLSETAAVNTTSVAQIRALMNLGDLDIFIMREQDLSEMAGAGYLKEMSALWDDLAETDPGLYERLTPMLRYAEDPADKSQKLYGIALDNCPLLMELNLTANGNVISMVKNTKRQTIILQALRLLYA